MSLTNTPKPGNSITNPNAKAVSYETWDSNTTTWDTETRTWDSMGTTWTNNSRPTTNITNISRP